MWGVVQTGGRVSTKITRKSISIQVNVTNGNSERSKLSVGLLKEMVELGNGTSGPLEPSFGMPKITHNVTILPSAFLGTGSSKVTRSWRSVMHASQSF